MKIETILYDRGLEGHIDGAKPKPVFADTQHPTEQERAALEKWQTDDKKAQTTIKLSVHDTQAIHLLGASTARQLWEQLKAAKEPRGQADLYAWRRKLYSTSAKETTDIPTHLNTMRQILETLRLIGDDISDGNYKILLLLSLPPSWEQFHIIYTQPANNTTSYELHAILLEEDRRRKEEQDNEEDESVLKRSSAGIRKRTSYQTRPRSKKRKYA